MCLMIITTLHPQFHPVEHADCDALALEYVLGAIEVVADLLERVGVFLVTFEVFLQQVGFRADHR